MEFAFFWFLFAIAVGVMASNRGRSGFGWFVISMLVSPLLGFIFCIASKNLAIPTLGQDAAAVPSDKTHVKCPKCAEYVLPQAVVCKHCNAALVPDPNYVLRQEQALKDQTAENSRNGMIGVAFIIGLFVLAWIIAKIFKT